MISASIAETHRFGRVRKNGYDPAEVDAVVARLVDALRQNDERIIALTEKIDAADASADAIRKTFVAAETTSTEIIERANADASAIVAEAQADADDLAATAQEMQTEIAEQRDRVLSEVYAEAEARMVEIERQTAERTADAEWAIQEAIEVRNRTVSETEAEAEAIVHAAEAHAATLKTDMTSMVQRAKALEQAAAALALSAQAESGTLDLTAVEELDPETEKVESVDETPEPSFIIDDSMPLDEDVDNEEAELLDDAPLTIVESEEEESEHDDEGPKTRYQQSTGVPLKERIKIARMSG